MATQGAKITLGTGKVVLLRFPKISDTETAAQEVSAKSNGDGNLLQILTQKALVKNLLVKIDDKPVLPTDNMDDLLNIGEYQQILKAVQKITGTGTDAGKEAQVESVVFGA